MTFITALYGASVSALMRTIFSVFSSSALWTRFWSSVSGIWIPLT
jgi:hypothetical protein